MAGKDYPEYLNPDQTQYLAVQGDYIYCKFAERPIRIIDNGKPVEMIAGDKYRPGHRFESVYVHNPDKQNPISAVLTIGTGDFSRQIVQGEIKAEPILRAADGTTRPDTRETVAIDLVPENIETITYQKYEIVKEGLNPVWPDGKETDSEEHTITRGYKNRLALVFVRYDTLQTMVVEYDKNLRVVRKIVSDDAVVIDSVAYKPGVGYVVSQNQGTGGDTLIRKVDSDALNTIGAISGNDFYGIQWIPEKSAWFANSSDGVWKLNDNFEPVEKITGYGSQKAFGYDAANDCLVIARNSLNSGFYRVKYEGGELLEVWEPGGENHAGAFSVDGNDMFVQLSFGGTTIKPQKRAISQYTTKPEFKARRPGCELKSALVNAGTLPQITADIEHQSEREGVILRGELIRAALEYHFRQAVADDYLDHVYSFQVTRDALGNPGMPVVAGNQTFARAEIADDFDMLTPGRVTLTIDNALTTTRPL